jgi:hypothetical protein
VEIEDSCGPSPAVSAAITGVNCSAEATAKLKAVMRNLRVMLVVVVLVMAVAMSMSTLAIVAPIAVLVAALLISLAVFPTLTLLIALALVVCIVALVFRFVFLRPHEVHGPIAGMVFTAVLAPISCMAGRYV